MSLLYTCADIEQPHGVLSLVAVVILSCALRSALRILAPGQLPGSVAHAISGLLEVAKLRFGRLALTNRRQDHDKWCKRSTAESGRVVHGQRWSILCVAETRDRLSEVLLWIQI